MEFMKLKDRVAIITGGGSGQGKAAAHLFANEGAKLVVAEWNENAGQEVAQSIVDQGGDALFIRGIVALTRIMSIDYGKHNIRVNCICPGVIDTPMIAEQLDKMKQNVSHLWPIGRIGQPQDIANAALFLASEDSSYITGAILPVDGGMNQTI
jgi:NAD(P)-dependent dehydrogenase (short-subunit alcohol dehydrogenase family)